MSEMCVCSHSVGLHENGESKCFGRLAMTRGASGFWDDSHNGSHLCRCTEFVPESEEDDAETVRGTPDSLDAFCLRGKGKDETVCQQCFLIHKGDCP